jgi:hypothetical protein
MYNLILPLIITIIIEFIILWLFKREKPLILFLYSILINSITLPLATYSYLYLYPNLILIEILVVLVEALIIKFLLEVHYKKAILISFVANLCTFLVGVIMGL